ncbi:hypothetical protein IWW50_006481, partial [Coemansia erecta]
MDAENEAGLELAVSFNGRLLYLYGYPDSGSLHDFGTQNVIDRPDAHGEMLRRQFQAKHKLASVLEGVGARVTTTHKEGASYVVIPDDCSEECRSDALAIGKPVVSESALLERVQSLQIAASGHQHRASDISGG